MTGLAGWAWWADPWLVIVNALAAFRVTRLLVVDGVPPLPRVRAAILRFALARWRKRHPPYGVDQVRDVYGDEPPLASLITCAWCVGWWVSAAVAVLATVAAPWWYLLAGALALSAITGIVTMIVERGE